MANSLYLHVPFCEHICYYCDFKRSVYNKEDVENWLFQIELDLKEKNINSYLKTIYIGGGTPTALNTEQLQRLLVLLQPYTSDIVEYTIESNLESLDEDKLKIMQEYGINRISLGVQSYDNTLLKNINRYHTKENIPIKIKMIRKYISNISIDLIYGFQDQSIELWKETLQLATNENVEHISIYSLTIEKNSVFGKRHIKPIDNEIEAQMYDIAIETLEEKGFHQYEIANFAKPNYQSKHNQCYWHYEDFYGIGVGASGKENHVRYTNTGLIKDYIEGKRIVEKEELSRNDEMFEYLMMNIRLKEGIDINTFNKHFSIDFITVFNKTIKKTIDNNWMIIDENKYRYTKEGMFVLHDILVLFMEEIEKKDF